MDQFEYYVVDFNKHKPYNIKSHDLYNIKFKTDKRFIYIDFDTIDQVTEFILLKKFNKHVMIIFYMYTNHQKITRYLSNLLISSTLDDILAKIVIFTNDYWYHLLPEPDMCLKDLFTPKNHYLVTFADCQDQLNFFHNRNYDCYYNKIIYNNIWTSYNESFVDFNNTPINKVAVSGTISKHYPERYTFLNYDNNNIVQLKNNGFDENYSKRLNGYICCFASSVHVYNMSTKKLTNTHLITLKYFEILASGSLLLCPDTESEKLNKLGLYNDVNCIMININNRKESIEKVNYIIDPINREKINHIRKMGQNTASEKLNSQAKYKELMDIFENIFNLDL